MANSLLTDAETILFTDFFYKCNHHEIERGPLRSNKHYLHLFKLGLNIME